MNIFIPFLCSYCASLSRTSFLVLQSWRFVLPIILFFLLFRKETLKEGDNIDWLDAILHPNLSPSLNNLPRFQELLNCKLAEKFSRIYWIDNYNYIWNEEILGLGLCIVAGIFSTLRTGSKPPIWVIQIWSLAPFWSSSFWSPIPIIDLLQQWLWLHSFSKIPLLISHCECRCHCWWEVDGCWVYQPKCYIL